MRYIMVFSFWWWFHIVVAQEEPLRNYTKSTALGLHLYTFGWGIDFHQTYKISERREHILKIDVASLKHKNESRNPSVYRDQGGKAYIYGKTHYCYNLGLTYGQQWNLIPKGAVHHVSLKAGISGGLALAILKPYFVEVINTKLSIIEVDQYSSSKYTVNDIVGESDYFQGFDKLTLIPGIRLKCHSLLDLGHEELFIRCIYTGFQADLFSRQPPIMDVVPNPRFYFSLFLGVMIGNRYGYSE